jgi:hypothetical protein
MSKIFILLIATAGAVIKFGNLPDPLTAIAQPGCLIKGNISWNTDGRIYHLPGMQDYNATVIDSKRGERWFCSESEAVASGWSKASR